MKKLLCAVLAAMLLISGEISAFAQVAAQDRFIEQNNAKWQDVLNADLSSPPPEYDASETGSPDNKHETEDITPYEVEYQLGRAKNEYEATRFIVKYKRLPDTYLESDSLARRRINESVSALRRSLSGTLKMMSELNMTATADAVADTYSETLIETMSPVTANEVLEMAEESGLSIEYVQPDYPVSLSSIDGEGVGESPAPIDIGIERAKLVSTGAGVKIAVIDTGFETTHPDITGKLLPGWDFFNNDGTVNDTDWKYDQGHGTHIAGVIAGVSDGVAPGAKIIPLKVFQGGAAYTSDIIEAIRFAEEAGAAVVNCSWGTPFENPALREAMEASEMLFVCAAGNGLRNLEKYPVYPASFKLPNVISVASVDVTGKLSRFSNYGTGSVDVAAPGEEVRGPWFDGAHVTNSGTSMAAAIVSGEAALVLDAMGSLSADDLKERVVMSSSAVTGLMDKVKDGKLIDAYYAVSANAAPNPAVLDIPNEPIPDMDYDADTSSGEYELYGADGYVSTRTPMPTARHGLGVVAVDGLIYAIGGVLQNGYTACQTVEVYDPKTDKWTTAAPMIDARSEFGCAVVNGKIYAIGGSHNTTQESIEMYDPETNTWTKKLNLPSSNMFPDVFNLYGNAAAAYEGNIYVSGGCAGSLGGIINGIYKYDVTNNSWSVYGSMQKARKYHSMHAYNGKLYINGGMPYGNSHPDNNYFSVTEEVFDLQTKTSIITGKSWPPRAYATSITDGNRFIAIGGYGSNDSTITQSLLTEDSGYIVKRDILSMPRLRHGAAMVDGVIYIIGGLSCNPSGEYATNAVEAVDSGYKARESLPEKLKEFEAVELNGNIYVLGGQNYSDGEHTYVKTMYRYNAGGNTWEQLEDLPAYYKDTAVISAYGKIYIIGGQTASSTNGP